MIDISGNYSDDGFYGRSFEEIRVMMVSINGISVCLSLNRLSSA